MRLLFDSTPETMYSLAKEGFSGGSQTYIKAIIKGMVERGHTVHVIANDLEVDEQRGEREFWWPPTYHPQRFDVAIQQMHVRPDPPYDAPILVLMTSCVDPQMGPNHEWATAVDAVPVFSEVHKSLLCKLRPIAPEKCYLTGLGVDLWEYDSWRIDRDQIEKGDRGYMDPLDDFKIPGRMLYANDPARGLFNMLDIFDLVKKAVPEATLHVAYDFDRQFGYRCWEHSAMAEMLWDCKKRLTSTPGVTNLGGISRDAIIREELGCQVHCMPSDPPGVGTQTHGITQMECAAAGAALVLSDVEAFPEVFSEGATILPVIGRFVPDAERRTTAQDYADEVVRLMKDPDAWLEASRKARVLAEKNTWSAVCDRWDAMLTDLAAKVYVERRLRQVGRDANGLAAKVIEGAKVA